MFSFFRRAKDGVDKRDKKTKEKYTGLGNQGSPSTSKKAKEEEAAEAIATPDRSWTTSRDADEATPWTEALKSIRPVEVARDEVNAVLSTWRATPDACVRREAVCEVNAVLAGNRTENQLKPKSDESSDDAVLPTPSTLISTPWTAALKSIRPVEVKKEAICEVNAVPSTPNTYSTSTSKSIRASAEKKSAVIDAEKRAVPLISAPSVPPLSAVVHSLPGACAADKETCVISTADASLSVESRAQLDEDVDEKKKKKRNLVSQEAGFKEQLEDLKQQLAVKDTDANKQCYRIEELQRDVIVKSSGMDRLQAELAAAHKESECVRQKLRLLENDVAEYRQKNVELSDELLKKSEVEEEEEEAASKKVIELEEAAANNDKKMEKILEELKTVREERDNYMTAIQQLEDEREEERTIVQEALEEVATEKLTYQSRFEHDFEKLRTVNTNHEQQLLNDFEWKLRELEQVCKRRLEDKDRKLEEKMEAYRCVTEGKLREAEKQLEEVQQLKLSSAELEQLRTMTHDQQKSLRQATRNYEQLQVSEMILKEEISRLKVALEREKCIQTTVQQDYMKKVADLEKSHKNRLEIRENDLNQLWESRLRHECTKLKEELEALYNKERIADRLMKEQELQSLKQSYELKVQDALKEIASLKASIKEKDSVHQKELEKAQTNTDRDILELRRKMDKLDMTYQSKIEKLNEDHEVAMEQLTWEVGRKSQLMDQTLQAQQSSARTTLELVKEQGERDLQDKLEVYEKRVREQLDEEWGNIVDEKELNLRLLEKAHVTELNSVKEEYESTLKTCNQRYSDLLSRNASLEDQLRGNSEVIGELRGNANLLEGSVQLLNDQISGHGKEMLLVQDQANQKLRDLEAEKQLRLIELTSQFKAKACERQEQFNSMQEQLCQKINALSKRLEELHAQYDNRPPRPEDTKLIASLQRELVNLTEEKNFYETELARRNSPDPLQHRHGPKKKTGQPLSKSTSGDTVSPKPHHKPPKSGVGNILRSRSMDYPGIKVPSKSPIRKAKKPLNGTQSYTISTL